MRELLALQRTGVCTEWIMEAVAESRVTRPDQPLPSAVQQAIGRKWMERAAA